jgi:hypothetical protein
VLSVATLSSCGKNENADATMKLAVQKFDAATTKPEPVAIPNSKEWGKNSLWDDGKAEVARYDAERIIYGKRRQYEAVLIVVKEDFNKAFYAKADYPEKVETLPVIKLNIVQEIPTTNYDYRFLTSVFVNRSDVFAPLKATMGSQEWCGNTFKEFKTWGGKTELVYHTYWDNEGDGSLALNFVDGYILEDQIPVAFRSLSFAQGLAFKTKMLPSLISSKLGKPELIDMEVNIVGDEKIQTKSGKFDVWKLEIRAEGKTSTYWFEKTFPNTLVRMEKPDGQTFMLKDRTRREYWVEGK